MINVKASDLKALLDRVAAVIPQKAVLPILESVLLFSDEDDLLRIRATDLNIFIETESKLAAPKWNAAVPFKALYETLKTLGDRNLSLEYNSTHLVIKTANGVYEHCLDTAGDFPKFPSLSDANLRIETNHAEISESLSKAIKNTTNDEMRPAMCGVLFEKARGVDTWDIVATDSRRLANIRTDLKSNLTDQEDYAFIMKAPMIKQVLQPAFAGNSLELRVFKKATDTWIQVQMPCVTIISKAEDATYPKWRPIVDSIKCDKKIVVKRDELNKSLRRISAYAEKQTNVTAITAEKNQIQIKAANEDFKQNATERIAATTEGIETAMTIGFNISYLMTQLSAIDTDMVEIWLQAANKAAIIKNNAPEANFDLILMPSKIG